MSCMMSLTNASSCSGMAPCDYGPTTGDRTTTITTAGTQTCLCGSRNSVFLTPSCTRIQCSSSLYLVILDEIIMTPICNVFCIKMFYHVHYSEENALSKKTI